MNLGYVCNLSCTHCHVNAGPRRTEIMDKATADAVLAFIERERIQTLDLTGGAPEMNPHFKAIVSRARQLGVKVIDRCNLVILLEPGHETLAEFLATQQVEIVASLPCYLENNVDKQRGKGTFEASITALRRLNALGYGQAGSGLELNLVFNPQGLNLPPPQESLEADYRQHLQEQYNIVFNRLFALTNLPVQRFGSTLISQGAFDDYIDLLRRNFKQDNLENVMCRSTISIDWQGYIYDCDFNQMLNLPFGATRQPKTHIRELTSRTLTGAPITVRQHCYGCTAGQGSSCGGALSD
ncbi:MAG: arsenosugar biosynthesis radical SAM protein ArsS [Methylomicrobium sp.]